MSGSVQPGDAGSQLRLDDLEHLTDADLPALIEALLLVAPDPPRVADLADAIGVPPARIEAAVAELASQAGRGWMVQRHGDHLHLATVPRFAPYVGRFLGLDREGKLSSAALETLAIIAYRQPVTRAEIEAVRGVDSSGVLATLHARELVEPVSRLAAVGNPFQYGTTIGFLRLFGLGSLADLPPLGTFGDEDGARLLDAAMPANGQRTADDAWGQSMEGTEQE